MSLRHIRCPPCRGAAAQSKARLGTSAGFRLSPGVGLLEQELGQLLATTPKQARAALARTFPHSPPPAAQALAAHPQRELRLIAAEIQSAFTRLLDPHWERIRTLLDADIVHRARTLAGAGAARMFEELHTGVRWRGDHLEFSDAAGIEGDPEVAAVGPGGLVLEPSVFIWPDLYIKRWTVTRTTVRYPARGAGVLGMPSRAPPRTRSRGSSGNAARNCRSCCVRRIPPPTSRAACGCPRARSHSTSRRSARPVSSAANLSAASTCT